MTAVTKPKVNLQL